ncbi:MAG: hypothetical protein ACM369_12910 [Acidobacteriota bacterium]|jgi:hypothetical protein
MRIENARSKRGSRSFPAAVVMDLGLVVAALLSMGSTPAKQAKLSVEAARPVAAALATQGSITPREAIADRDTLDLQLD